MNRFSCLTPAILVLSLTAATPALPQDHRGAAPRTTSFGEALRSFLPDFVGRLWADLGCVVDPYGSCRPARMESGCGLDPYGACKPAGAPAAQPGFTSLSGDSGCVIDPFGGHCATQSTSGH